MLLISGRETLIENFFDYQNGPTDMTELRTTNGRSNVDCAMICSADTECRAFKPIKSSSGNDVICEMYAELDTNNFSPKTDVYVKD